MVIAENILEELIRNGVNKIHQPVFTSSCTVVGSVVLVILFSLQVYAVWYGFRTTRLIPLVIAKNVLKLSDLLQTGFIVIDIASEDFSCGEHSSERF